MFQNTRVHPTWKIEWKKERPKKKDVTLRPYNRPRLLPLFLLLLLLLLLSLSEWETSFLLYSIIKTY